MSVGSEAHAVPQRLSLPPVLVAALREELFTWEPTGLWRSGGAGETFATVGHPGALPDRPVVDFTVAESPDGSTRLRAAALTDAGDLWTSSLEAGQEGAWTQTLPATRAPARAVTCWSPMPGRLAQAVADTHGLWVRTSGDGSGFSRWSEVSPTPGVIAIAGKGLGDTQSLYVVTGTGQLQRRTQRGGHWGDQHVEELPAGASAVRVSLGAGPEGWWLVGVVLGDGSALLRWDHEDHVGRWRRLRFEDCAITCLALVGSGDALHLVTGTDTGAVYASTWLGEHNGWSTAARLLRLPPSSTGPVATVLPMQVARAAAADSFVAYPDASVVGAEDGDRPTGIPDDPEAQDSSGSGPDEDEVDGWHGSLHDAARRLRARPDGIDTELIPPAARIDPEHATSVLTGCRIEKLTDADPRELGGFGLKGRIAAGNADSVKYLAWHPAHGHAFLKAVRGSDLAGRQMLEQEGNVARKVRGALVPRLLAAGEDGAWCYVAFSFIAGSNLEQRLATLPRQRLADEGQVVLLASSILDSLKAFHAARWLHGDVKPANIIDKYGTPYLVDYGSAIHLDHPDPDVLRSGTTEYVAPEQADHDVVTEKADLFAFAACVARIASGVQPLPWRERNEDHTVTPAAGRQPVLDDVPDALRELLASLLHEDPEMRPGMEEVSARIAKIAARHIREAPRPAGSSTSTPLVGPAGVGGRVEDELVRLGAMSQVGHVGVMAVLWVVLVFIGLVVGLMVGRG